MKKIVIPENTYQTATMGGAKNILRNKMKKNMRDGNSFSLGGAFKLLRRKPTLSPFGDFPLLAECIFFFRENKLKFTKHEVRRCLNYFEDYNTRQRSFNNQLVDSLLSK